MKTPVKAVFPNRVRRDPERLYLLRVGLRVFVIALITLFIGRQYLVFAAAIVVATFALYAASFVFRNRNEELSDALLTLGDLPALVGIVHLPAHAPAFEAVIPVWLIGSTIANLRKGRPALLPFYSLAAWLVLVSHATSTDDPLGYAVVQTLAVGVASAVSLSVVLERRGHRTDSLTGTLTRGAGLEELTRLGKQGGDLTLAFIDLRHFKAVNDRYGHAVGDEVLSIVSGRLQHALRRDDVLFRYGGDEFIAASRAPDLEGRLREVFSQPVKTQSATLQVGARIGIQSKSGAIDIDAVVHEADRRMYSDLGPSAPLEPSPTPEQVEMNV